MDITQLADWLDFKLIALLIISSYWVKKNLEGVFLKISVAHKILIWSTVVSALYWLLIKTTGIDENIDFVKLLLSYFAATSFYEVAFEPLERFAKNIFNKEK